MAVDAPAASALAMSPEYCSPPSAITGTPCGAHAATASRIAVICGAPTPATTRVVQMEPGPTPTLTASAPASTSAAAAGAGGDVAADHLDAVADHGLEPVHHVEHAAVVGVRGVHDQHVDPGVDQRHRPRPRVVADTDRGTDQQPAVAVLGGQRELLGLDEVLDGDQPGQLAVAVDDRQLLDLVAAQQPQRGLGGDARLRGDQRRLRHHLGRPACSGRPRSACRGW